MSEHPQSIVRNTRARPGNPAAAPPRPGQAGIGAPAHSLSRVRLAVAILYVFTVALIIGLVGTAIRADYRYSISQAKTQTSTLVTTLEEHVVRTALDSDRVLRGLSEHIAALGGVAAIGPAELHRMLKRQAEDAPQLENILLLDSKGDITAAALPFPFKPVNLRDRDYFQHHLNDASGAPHIGKRIQSRLTGNTLLVVSRRINGTDGSFQGVLATGIETRYFRNFYERLNLPQDSSILITRRDGFLLFRHPEPKLHRDSDDIAHMSLFQEALPRAPVGTYEAHGPFDDLDRIASYRNVSELPLVVVLTIPKAVALERWKHDSLEKVAFAATVIVLLTWLASLVRRQLGRAERAESALRASRSRFEALATLSSDGFWEQDPDYRFSWLGERMRSRLGSCAECFLGKLPWELPVSNLNEADWEHHRQVLDGRLPFRDLVLKIVHGNQTMWLSMSGNPMFDEHGRFVGYHGATHDITGEMEERAEITRLAFLDPLTRLPNRALLRDRIDQAIVSARRSEESFALLFIDLDGFKAVNDSHGHHVGDLLLKLVAQRLQETLRESDTVARFGGDEFVALLQESGQAVAAAAVTAKLLDVLSENYEIEGSVVRITPSIGLALFPEHGTSTDALLRAADEAMYSVKAAGRAGVAIAKAAG